MSASSSDTNLTNNDPGDLTENELWAELAKFAKPQRKPNGITAMELAELWKCSPPTARRWLIAHEKAGEYCHEDCMQLHSDDGILHKVRVWYKHKR